MTITRLAEVQEYLRPLAAQQLLVAETCTRPESMRLQVTPTNPHAASIQSYLECRTGFMTITAGQGFAIDDHYWDHFPAALVVAAIVQGALHETIRLWRGRAVGSSSYLPIAGEAQPIHSNRTHRLSGELLRLVTGMRHTYHQLYRPYQDDLGLVDKFVRESREG